MKVIFLDIDGVLTTANKKWTFDENCVKHLVDIINETDAYIVISSSWRSYDLEETKLRLINKFWPEFINQS